MSKTHQNGSTLVKAFSSLLIALSISRANANPIPKREIGRIKDSKLDLTHHLSKRSDGIDAYSCDDNSTQCCWAIRAYFSLGGYTPSDSNKDSPSDCCFLEGIECQPQSDNKFIVVEM